jgi:hypothetical protein
MSFKNRLGIILVILGFISLPSIRFGGEFLLISAFLIVFGATTIVRELGGKEKLRGLLSSSRRSASNPERGPAPSRIDPLLPVRVLKLADSHAGVLTVSIVAMALNVGLDECQVALDDLVRKGAASVDIDLSTGVASYRFPEFLPHTIEGAGPL